MFYSVLISFFLLMSNCSFALMQDFTHVAKEAIPAVVYIQVKSEGSRFNTSNFEDPFSDPFQDEFFNRFFERRAPREPLLSQGSGFLISKEGHILTNNHVVNGAHSIMVTLNDGKEYVGKVVGQDPNTDLALIKIEGNDFPFLELGNSDRLEVGQWVIAVGNPLGLQASLTVGVVSAKGRNNLDLAKIEDFIQTDTPINRGNSGGPLLDMEGKVVGINTAIVSTIHSGGYMGIGFAIPSNISRFVIDELLMKGEVSRGILGVALQPLNKDLAQAFGLEKPEGALVVDVQKGGEAERAGVQQGDVIVSYNKKKISNVGQLKTLIALMKPGEALNLEILRGGKKISLQAHLGSIAKEAPIKNRSLPHLGIEIGNVQEGNGVLVTKIDPTSLAYMAGIRQGSQIVSLNQKKVLNMEDFNQIFTETKEGKPLLFLIKQGDGMRFISIHMG